VASKQKHDLGFQKRQDKIKSKRERAKSRRKPCATLNWCRGANHPYSCHMETCPDNLTDMKVGWR